MKSFLFYIFQFVLLRFALKIVWFFGHNTMTNLTEPSTEPFLSYDLLLNVQGYKAALIFMPAR